MANEVAAPAVNPFANIPLLVRGPNGQTFINRAKYAQKVFHLQAESYPCTVTSSGRNRTSLLPPADQGGDGDLELYYLMASSTGAFSVSLNLTTLNRRLMNGPVESSLIFGNGTLPSRLLSPLFIPATTTLDIELNDLSVGSNEIKIAGLGHQIVDPMANFSGITALDRRGRLLDPMKHPFWLTTDNGAQVTIAANSSATYTLSVPSVADFNCWGLLHRTTADYTIQLFEGNRRRLMNAATNISQLSSKTLSVTGMPDDLVPAASMPMYWPFTHLFQRGTTISAVLTNPTGSTITTSIAFPGELVYYPPCPPILSQPGPAGAVVPSPYARQAR